MEGSRVTAFTPWQTIAQSQLIHPEWSVADHLSYLEHDAFYPRGLLPSPEVTERWLTEFATATTLDTMPISCPPHFRARCQTCSRMVETEREPIYRGDMSWTFRCGGHRQKGD